MSLLYYCKLLLNTDFVGFTAVTVRAFTYSAYNTAAMKSTPLNKEIKHRRTTTYFVIFKANTLCTLPFSSILYTNRLLVYPSAREALAKKINISCVWVY